MPEGWGAGDWLAFALHTNDSAFPTGGYAHSLGLEGCVELGLVRDEASLLEYLRHHALPALRYCELPLLRAAHRAASKIASEATHGDPDPQRMAELYEIDAELHARKPAREMREASIQSGRRRLEMLCKLSPTPILCAYRDAVSEGGAHGHLACVYGAAYAMWDERVAVVAFCHQAVAGPCLAAPKLIRLGQDGAHRGLSACLRETLTWGEDEIAVEDAGWFDPVTEIASMRHEVAAERLFIS